MFSPNLAVCLATSIYCSKLEESPQPLLPQLTISAAVQAISTVQAYSLKSPPPAGKLRDAVNPSVQINDSTGLAHSGSDSIYPHFSAPVTSGSALLPSPEPSPHTSAEFLLAAPQNFNPGLAPPPPPPPPPEVPPNPPESSEEPSISQPLVINLESVDLNFQDTSSNFGQSNHIIEPTFNFNINDEFSVAVTTGFDFFNQPNVRSVANVPLRFSWQDEIDDLKVTVGGGVDLFDRLPPQPNFSGSVAIPVFSTVTLTPVVEYGAYKFNAKTLENQITALRFGTSLYWQIDSDTSLFSLFRLGVYNDGNFEQQSFSRLERRIGNFSLALNLFNWVYRENLELQSGYFAPNDFLVYNGEIAWQDDIFDFLNCRAALSLGRGRLQGSWTSSSSVRGLCTVQISPEVSFNLGYSFSDVKDKLTGGSAYNSRGITGRLSINF
jgi:hypothetical protein